MLDDLQCCSTLATNGLALGEGGDFHHPDSYRD